MLTPAYDAGATIHSPAIIAIENFMVTPSLSAILPDKNRCFLKRFSVRPMRQGVKIFAVNY